VGCHKATLKFAAGNLRADWEVVLTAIASDALALEHASAGLRADRAVVTAALRQNPFALEYASPGLRGDREVVMTALRYSDTSTYGHEKVKNVIRDRTHPYEYEYIRCCRESKHCLAMQCHAKDGSNTMPARYFPRKKVLQLASIALQVDLQQEHRQAQARQRYRRNTGGLKGRRALLPACDGGFHCAVWWFDVEGAAARMVKKRKTAKPNPKEQLRGHVRTHHANSDLACFMGTSKNQLGHMHYGLCVCQKTPCVYTGPTRDGEVWVRHPDAHDWQAQLMASISQPINCLSTGTSQPGHVLPK
jgi:hypothetical protein